MEATMHSTVDLRKAIAQYNKIRHNLGQMTVYEQITALEKSYSLVKEEHLRYVCLGGTKHLEYIYRVNGDIKSIRLS